MFTSGYISLWRSILEWEWYDDINTTRLFIHLLLRANFEDKEWHGITVKRGSRVSSLEVLSKETNLSIKQVRTAIKHLERTGEVARRKYPEFTVFTLVNYDKYQDVAREVARQRQSKDKVGSEKRQQYNKYNKENKDNKSAPPLGIEDGVTDMYDPNYDFGYIPEGKDF